MLTLLCAPPLLALPSWAAPEEESRVATVSEQFTSVLGHSDLVGLFLVFVWGWGLGALQRPTVFLVSMSAIAYGGSLDSLFLSSCLLCGN